MTKQKTKPTEGSAASTDAGKSAALIALARDKPITALALAIVLTNGGHLGLRELVQELRADPAPVVSQQSAHSADDCEQRLEAAEFQIDTLFDLVYRMKHAQREDEDAGMTLADPQ